MLIINDLLKYMVRVEGLEPPRLAAPEPKSGASTNFATPAQIFFPMRHYQKGYPVASAKMHFFKLFFILYPRVITNLFFAYFLIKAIKD